LRRLLLKLGLNHLILLLELISQRVQGHSIGRTYITLETVKTLMNKQLSNTGRTLSVFNEDNLTSFFDFGDDMYTVWLVIYGYVDQRNPIKFLL
ncbi:hypothetical protein MKX01_037190, partial [Papaver californicum]